MSLIVRVSGIKESPFVASSVNLFNAKNKLIIKINQTRLQDKKEQKKIYFLQITYIRTYS